jgi:predicted DCC family thiol-disulfide oxidoreductase YuxK
MPTGARYSVDAVLRAARGEPIETHATALPLRLGQLQIAWIYLDTVLNKWPGVEWHNGSALHLALGLDHLYTRALGKLLFDQQWLGALGTHSLLFAEAAMLPLVFLPLGRPSRGPFSKLPAWLFQPTWKAMGIALVIAMHLGIASLMAVGNFLAVMISACFLLFEPEWIEWLISTLKRLWGGRVTSVYYDGECGVCTRIAKILRGFDAFGSLDLINLHERGALAGIPANLSKRELEQRLCVVDSDGAVRSGWLACIRIAQRLPVLAGLGFLGAAPGIRRLGDALYDRFAAHRKDFAKPRLRSLRVARWVAMVPDQVKDPGRGLLNGALVFLMFSTLWFSLPQDGKIPPLVLNGRVLTPMFDVSPSRMWRPLSDTIYTLELWQRWDLFPTKKLDSDMYMVGRGELTDGTQVDVVRGDRGNGAGPLLPPVDPGFFFTRWTEYVANIELESEKSPWRLELGKFICRQWNNDAPRGRAQLKTFKLYKEYRRVPLLGEAPSEWQEVMIWDHYCF